MTTSTWERRFHVLRIDAFELARDRPDRGIVTAGGIEPHQLHAWNRQTGQLQQLTAAPRGIVDGWISADGEWVYYVDDPEASEEGFLVRVPWAGGGVERADPDLGRGFIVGVTSFGLTTAFTIQVGDRYEHRIVGGGGRGSRLVATDDQLAYVAAFADDGHTLAVARFKPDGHREAVMRDVATGAQLTILTEPDVTLVAYTPSPVHGDARFLAETSASGARRPFLWDRRTGAREPIPVDDLEGDVRPLDWSPDGRWILLLQIHRAETRFHAHDLATGERRAIDAPPGALTALPETFATVIGPDGEVLTVWQSGLQPRALISLSLDGGRQPTVVLGDQALPAATPWRSITFPTADGTPIQAWLAVPRGEEPFPVVVDVHGGPGVVQFDEYLPHLQAFVDAGALVISLNYRGSSTFGDAFERAILGHPGELEVDDMVAAVDHLVAEGLADPTRVIAEGWSYGGYLVLMALSRHPERWAAGICGVGIGDMAAQHAEAAPFISQMFTGVFEGTPAEVPGRYIEASPITHAAAVKAPLLVIHGRGDIRCPAGQMERYLERMAELEKDVTVEWFSAGHLGGVASPALLLDHTRLMLQFAHRVASLPVAADD